MKRLFALFALIIVALFSLTGCDSSTGPKQDVDPQPKPFWSLTDSGVKRGIIQGIPAPRDADPKKWDKYQFETPGTRRQFFTAIERAIEPIWQELRRNANEDEKTRALAWAALLTAFLWPLVIGLILWLLWRRHVARRSDAIDTPTTPSSSEVEPATVEASSTSTVPTEPMAAPFKEPITASVTETASTSNDSTEKGKKEMPEQNDNTASHESFYVLLAKAQDRTIIEQSEDMQVVRELSLAAIEAVKAVAIAHAKQSTPISFGNIGCNNGGGGASASSDGNACDNSNHRASIRMRSDRFVRRRTTPSEPSNNHSAPTSVGVGDEI